MRRTRPALVFLSLGLIVPATSLAQLVDVETYSGNKTYTYVLPGAPSGSGLLFVEDLTVTGLTFTPGSVVFQGQPVDFSGTEASFLAGTYSGHVVTPVSQATSLSFEARNSTGLR